MPRRVTTVFVACIAMAWCGAAAQAQEGVRVAIDPGTDVRFVLRDSASGRESGRVEQLAGDTLRLAARASAAPRSVLLRDLSLLEVRGGRDRRRGVIIGAALGTSITAVAGGIDVSRDVISVGEVVSAAVLNAALGGLIGYALSPGGWERVPLPPR